MELGSITNKNEERVFLLSTTHGAEMNGLAAFIETTNFLKKHDVIDKNWRYGSKLIFEGNKIARQYGIEKYFSFSGVACSPYYNCLNKKLENSMELRTLFIQEMLKHKILMPWISIAFRHSDKELNRTLIAIDKSLSVLKKALKGNIKRFINGEIIKPVFRKYN
tara:strand:- start:59 stop:550 length:492 start_codon:yes stop_codon:yes gene_type:complete